MQNIHLIVRPKIASHRVSLSALRFFATSAPHLARLFIFCNLSACTMEEVLEMYFGKFQTGAKVSFWIYLVQALFVQLNKATYKTFGIQQQINKFDATGY